VEGNPEKTGPHPGRTELMQGAWIHIPTAQADAFRTVLRLNKLAKQQLASKTREFNAVLAELQTYSLPTNCTFYATKIYLLSELICNITQ
jgi:hypothetical protein